LTPQCGYFLGQEQDSSCESDFVFPRAVPKEIFGYILQRKLFP